MSPHAFLHRKPLPEARSLLLDGIRPVDAEDVDAGDACDRIAAETIFAVHPSPHYRASAMDGVAVRASDTFTASAQTPVRLTFVAGVGESGAAGGDVESGSAAANAASGGAAAAAATAFQRGAATAGKTDVASGEAAAALCHAVDTGSPLAEWADAVLRIENVTVSDGTCIVKAAVPPGRDVRRAGEDIDAGAVVVPAGAKLRPCDVGVALATGTSRVRVRRRPRVAIIATGSEVVEPGGTAAPGQVIEYNSRIIGGLVAEWGGRAERLGIVADDEAAIASLIESACRAFDVVCVIAGSSAGRKDLTIPVLQQLGDVFVHGVDMAPGRPVALARVGATPVVAVPGYPVSAVVACEQLLRPLIAALLGAAEQVPDTVDAIVRRKLPSRLGIEEFRRVCLTRAGDGYVVAPLPAGAGSISTVAGAHGWLRIPTNREGIDAGESVAIELIVTRAEVDASLVIGGPPCAAGAQIEQRLRLIHPRARVHYLRLGEFDAAGAVERGEAHLVLVAGGAADAEALAADTAPDVAAGLVTLRVCGSDGVRALAGVAGLQESAALRTLVEASLLEPA